MTGGLGALGDAGAILADATAYLEATGHVVVAWLWLEQCWSPRTATRAPSTTASGSPRATSSTRELPTIATDARPARPGRPATLDLDPDWL